MPKETEVRIDLDGLENLRAKLGSTYRTRIGILGEKATRANKKGEALNNAQVGLIQMFGTIDGRIPPRDFLIMPIQVGRKDLLGAMNSNAVRTAVENGRYKDVFELLGQAARGVVLQAFASRGYGQWEANKPSTIAKKGSSAPLIDTSQLEGAIDYDVVKGSTSGQPGNLL